MTSLCRVDNLPKQINHRWWAYRSTRSLCQIKPCQETSGSLNLTASHMRQDFTLWIWVSFHNIQLSLLISKSRKSKLDSKCCKSGCMWWIWLRGLGKRNSHCPEESLQWAYEVSLIEKLSNFYYEMPSKSCSTMGWTTKNCCDHFQSYIQWSY